MSLRGLKGRGNLLHHRQKALIPFDIGFVFHRSKPPKNIKIPINLYHHRSNIILPILTLALFFQTNVLFKVPESVIARPKAVAIFCFINRKSNRSV
jgi:hypothetical protein